MVQYRVFHRHHINLFLLILMLQKLSDKKAVFSAAFLFCIASGGFYYCCFALSRNLSFAETLPSQEKLEIFTSKGSSTIEVEIAETPQEQATGLMFRKKLPSNKGMLFIYKPPKEVSMWMRNTYIPLDMIFIREDGIVHRIEKETEPLSEEIISSNGSVSAVLEIPAGVAERLGLKVGDKIQHSFFKAR